MPRHGAEYIIGETIKVARLGGVRAKISTVDSQKVSGTHGLANVLAEEGEFDPGEAVHAISDMVVKPAAVAEDEYAEKSKGKSFAKIAEQLSLNLQARPDVGDAYVTQTISLKSCQRACGVIRTRR